MSAENYVIRKAVRISGSTLVSIPPEYYDALGSPAYFRVELIKDDGAVFLRVKPIEEEG